VGTPVIALAASTGGPSALRTVVTHLAGLDATILVVQHIHHDFALSFASWLQDSTGLRVTLPAHGDPAMPGEVHLAPPDVHLRLGRDRRLELHPEPAGLLSRPSCDELLRSVAEHAGALGVGVVLTGMGDDGARGLLSMRERGAATFAQDGESSAVDGMPRAARELGGAQRTLPLDRIGPAVAEATRRAGVR
jgi:two-component system chemotaxis response regulator CheB